MVEKISNKIFSILSDENDTKEQNEILLFGITRIIEDIPKYLGLLIICIFLGRIKEFALVMLVTALYKTFTGGVHLHTNIGCFIGYVISVLCSIYLPLLLFKSSRILIITSIYTYIFSIYVICVYVPADVPEIPIINKKRRKRDKIVSFIVLNILFVISLLIIKNSIYSGIVIITILITDIMTTRTIYKLFRNEYGYETYIPDELLIVD